MRSSAIAYEAVGRFMLTVGLDIDQNRLQILEILGPWLRVVP